MQNNPYLNIFSGFDSLLVNSNNSITLQNKLWNEVSGVLNGYYIAFSDGGLLVIDSIDLNNKNTAFISIINHPLKSLYSTSEWFMQVPTYIDYSKYLTEFESSKPLIQFFTNLLSRYSNDGNDSINRFRNLNDIYNIDTEFLSRSLVDLGFNVDITNAIDEFNESVSRRLIREVCNYFTISGTEYTIDFLAYVHSSILEIRKLYTTDYITFTEDSDDPKSYLTSRVNVVYDIQNYNKPGDLEKLVDIFYKLSPIHIVINYIQAIFKDATGLKLSSADRSNEPPLDTTLHDNKLVPIQDVNGVTLQYIIDTTAIDEITYLTFIDGSYFYAVSTTVNNYDAALTPIN